MSASRHHIPSPVAFVTPSWESRSDAVFWLEWALVFCRGRLTHTCSEGYRCILLEALGYLKALLDVECHLPVKTLLEKTKIVYDLLCREKVALSAQHCLSHNCSVTQNDIA